ncbi:hypothetical protein X777_07368, partial [Ooceraea biroi]
LYIYSLENVFGTIRSHNRRNINPTCTNFESSFKTLLINNLTGKRTVGGNCEIDNGKALFSLQHFVENSVEILNSTASNMDTDTEEIAEIDNISVNASSICTNNHEAIINKLLSMQPFNTCSSCKEAMLLKEMEFTVINGCTTWKNMSSVCFRTHDVSQKLGAIIKEKVDFSFFNCAEHKQEFYNSFLQVIIEHFSIPQWCSNINKILRGKNIRKPQNIIEHQAVQYYHMRYKKHHCAL